MNGTRVCSIDGCANARSTRGWCKPHYDRWRKYDDPLGGRPAPSRTAICDVDACGIRAVTAGLCNSHYLRLQRHGSPLGGGSPKAMDDPEGVRRLRERAVRDGDCLRWTGLIRANGYGKISVQGRLVYVHRLAYEVAKGPIPDGLEIDHLCRVRDCINPDHLEAVTHAENVRRIPAHLRARS